jgi:hypothetical protein
VLDRHGLVAHRRRRRRPAAHRHALGGRQPSQRALVRRLQGRVPAPQSPVLLPADDQRRRESLSPGV